MIDIRIVGVPEHFNLPWHMAIEEGAFSDRGINLRWTEVPEGTGRMAQMLKEGETDLAVILTEGVIKAVDKGLQAVIAQEYVKSPLLWGVHVAESSPYQNFDDLQGKIAAISRFGSGSHLMTYVFAEGLGWDTEQLKFEVVHNLEGGTEALQKGDADFFLWERFTTKPLVDKGIFRWLGDCPTPWPCFVVAASNSLVQEKPQILSHILEVINTYTKDFKQIPSIDRTLANRYGIQLDDIRSWLSQTQWSQDQLDPQILDLVQDRLLDLNLISNRISENNLLWKPTN